MVSKLIVFHLPAYLYYLYFVVYDFINIETGSGGFGGKFKFLTIWNAWLQTVYFGLATANDCCGTHFRPSNDCNAKKSFLQRWRDALMSCIVFPLSMFVVFTFWGIYAVDRELIFPKKLDDVIPPWLNHAFHTNILPIMLAEVFMVYHQYPSKRQGIGAILGLSLIYLAWILFIAYYDKFWVYPILRVLQVHQRAAFIGCLLLVFVFIYLLGDLINRIFWGRERKIASQMNQKKTK